MATPVPPTGERILPGTHVLIRLPSGAPRVIRILPDTTISLGKFGAFPANALIHRPYNLTFDILDAPATGLRVVSAAEITRDILGGDAEAELEAGGHYELEYEDAEGGDQIMRTNRETVDDPLAQKMSWVEIEELKKQGTGSGRDLVQKLLSSHSALHQKTPFALQKYTLRKTKKFLRRFTVLPLTVQSLTHYLLECKEPVKMLDLRDETLALMLSLANVHWGGRWLVVDESGGLVVAAVAERLGLLEYTPDVDEDKSTKVPGGGEEKAPEKEKEEEKEKDVDGEKEKDVDGEKEKVEKKMKEEGKVKEEEKDISPDMEKVNETEEGENKEKNQEDPAPPKRYIKRREPPPPTRNTITLIHPNEQPNISLLKYFCYDTNIPTTSHPLHTHLRTINWLHVVAPEADTTLQPPPPQTPEELAVLKSSKRSSYYRKSRRWERATAIIADTQRGGFDGLLVAGFMELQGVLRHTVPLLSGSAQVVVYSPNRESVAEIADLYSSARKAEWMQRGSGTTAAEDELDPTLLLAPTIHVTTARRYQVLPGRTHPVMTSRGGGEGCIFHAVKVLPVEGNVQAKGLFRGTKKRRDEQEEEGEEEKEDGTGSPTKRMKGGR